ncbi:hypothetical protein [Bradyrhizobium sp. DASA03120]
MRKLFSDLDDKTRNFILLYVNVAIAVCLSAAIGGVIQLLRNMF